MSLYFRQGVIGFIEKLNLTDVTLVGESIGGAWPSPSQPQFRSA